MNAVDRAPTWGWFARSLFWIGQTTVATLGLYAVWGVAFGDGSSAQFGFVVTVTVVSAALLFRQVNELFEEKIRASVDASVDDEPVAGADNRGTNP